MNRISVMLIAMSLLVVGQVRANPPLEVQRVTDDVYAIVGELGNRSPENLGNNATFAFVVTDEGVVLVDSGGTAAGAAAIDAAIDTVTDQPVVKVINSGGQDHRWLGNSYFKEQGVEIIASENAVIDQQARSENQLMLLANLVGEQGSASTKPVVAETTFESEFRFELGGKSFEIYHKGQAHTPGDSYIWLPQEKVMLTGDIVYIDRMLGVGSQSNSQSWLSVYDSMAAHNPEHLVPGHGPATSLEKANQDTYSYLVFLRESVGAFMDDGGEMTGIGSVDQSEFSYLLNFDSISGRNAQQVYSEMEWE